MGNSLSHTMSAEALSAQADMTEEYDWDIYPQMTQHPHTIIAGDVVDIRARTGTTSVGVVFENPTIVKGSAWKNRETPEGFDSAAEFNAALRAATTDVEDYANGTEVTEEIQSTAREAIEAAVDEDIDFSAGEDAYEAHRLGVDYKLADEGDRDFKRQEVDDTLLGVSVGSDTFPSTQVETIEEDRVMVWYRGISGQFIGQALDFNGRPSARFKDDGYLVKGLLQNPLGWFDRDEDNYPDLVDTTNRRDIASRDGKGMPPRFARPAVLRDDVEGREVFIDIARYNDGNMLSATTAFNEGDWTIEEYLDAAGGSDSVFETLDSLEGPQPRYEESPEEVLVGAFDLDSGDDIEYLYDLHDGNGWQPIPDNAFYGVGDQGSDGDSGGSFDTPELAGDSVEHPTDQEVEFAEMLSEMLAGTGADPDDGGTFKDPTGDGFTDLEGVVGHNADQFSVTPSVDAIREVIYENVSHLDADDL